ncbi:MAG TPA: DUF6569 family protein [Flavisolibacter sp.]|nr:DUF6569 family protein [Flavisolibacter sp.]
MKLTALLFLLVLPLLCISQYTYQQLNVNFLQKESDATVYTFENLRLYPVYAKENFKSHFKNVGQYMPLTEAIQKKKVRISEKDQSGTVNSLAVENLSQDTIIIICGDVVKGGKQDRIIETDMVLAPKSGKKNLNVYCVESGRWNDGRQQAMTSNRNSRPAAPAAAFSGHFNKGSMSLRKVVEKEKDQSKVWAQVDKINSNNKTQTETKTYTALTQSVDYSKKLQQYVSFFQNKFAKDSNVIGVVVVSGNKVLGCDLFATPALFRSQFPSLLHSYVTEAIVSGSKVTASPAVVKTYMDGLLKDETSQTKVLKEKGSSFNDKGRKLRVSSFD